MFVSSVSRVLDVKVAFPSVAKCRTCSNLYSSLSLNRRNLRLNLSNKTKGFNYVCVSNEEYKDRTKSTIETTLVKDSTNLLRRSILSSLAVAGVAFPLHLPQDAQALVQFPQRLHNRYIMVRHGESELEVRHKIQSNPGMKYDVTWSLTEAGRAQMHSAARTIQEELDVTPSWIYTSNFQRAYQSALILREDCYLLFADMRTEFSGLLDPRKMGALELQDISTMDLVWENDLQDISSRPPAVTSSLEPTASTESCLDLYRRAIECFSRLEGSMFGEDIVLVSHGDTLSLFCAALYGTDLGRHHLDWAFEPGQVRLVDITKAPQNNEYDPKDIRGTLAIPPTGADA